MDKLAEFHAESPLLQVHLLERVCPSSDLTVDGLGGLPQLGHLDPCLSGDRSELGALLAAPAHNALRQALRFTGRVGLGCAPALPSRCVSSKAATAAAAARQSRPRSL